MHARRNARWFGRHCDRGFCLCMIGGRLGSIDPSVEPLVHSFARTFRLGCSVFATRRSSYMSHWITGDDEGLAQSNGKIECHID